MPICVAHARVGLSVCDFGSLMRMLFGACAAHGRICDTQTATKIRSMQTMNVHVFFSARPLWSLLPIG